ncbi:MAG: hypothetical protein DCC49_10440 [Acidobacteria bacterium]|nr:MAG: hypothetical protein DCC49_10440 [Acidobacteriota bacterium]
MKKKYLILAVGDLAAISLFVPLGVRSHNSAITFAVIARNLLPLIVSWVVVAFILDTYKKGGIWRLLLTWLIAVPIALLVRAALLGRVFTTVTAVFIPIAMSAILGLLAAWRVIAWLVWRFVGPGGGKAEGEMLDQNAVTERS